MDRPHEPDVLAALGTPSFGARAEAVLEEYKHNLRRIAELARAQGAAVFRTFLDAIDRNVPAALDIHLVLDNCSTHKTRLIRRW
jgi:hypothetical protein